MLRGEGNITGGSRGRRPSRKAGHLYIATWLLLFATLSGVWPTFFGSSVDPDASREQRVFVEIMQEYLAARSTAADGYARRRINNRYNLELVRAAMAVGEWRGRLTEVAVHDERVVGLTVAVSDTVRLTLNRWPPPRWQYPPRLPEDNGPRLVRGDRVAITIWFPRVAPNEVVFNNFHLRRAEWPARPPAEQRRYTK